MSSLIDANFSSRSPYSCGSNLGISYLGKDFGAEIIAASITYYSKEASFLQL